MLANLEIGLHEQTRLQPEIREALDAPSATKEDLGRRALEALFPSAPRCGRPSGARPRPSPASSRPRVQRASNRLAREVITDSFMVLSLPGRTLALGTHLADEYPEPLREPADAELTELLARFEPVAPAPDDCGARDWSDLDQRMHYIVHLFCAFHLRRSCRRPPFTPEQVERLRPRRGAGRRVVTRPARRNSWVVGRQVDRFEREPLASGFTFQSKATQRDERPGSATGGMTI